MRMASLHLPLCGLQATLSGVKAVWGKRHSDFAKASVKGTKLALLILTVGSVWMGYMHYTHSLGKWGTGWWVRTCTLFPLSLPLSLSPSSLSLIRPASLPSDSLS